MKSLGILFFVLLVISTNIVCSQNCDTIYRHNNQIIDAKFGNGATDIYSYLGQSLYCKPLGDSINFKLVTFLIDKEGKPYAKKIEGYKSDCKYYIQKKIEKMPFWIPATKEGKCVCYEETLPIAFGQSKKE